jgi:LacI family transcriptional regulator
MKKDSPNIRIVDIAKRAGVSVGTVDRVLHRRGRVAPEKEARIEKILKELNYEPNMVARVLASKRSYKYAVVVPVYRDGEYWDLLCKGIDRAGDEMRKFNISTDYLHFDQSDRSSFLKVAGELREKNYDGIVLATLFGELVINMSKELDEKDIPYVYIDADIPGQKNLVYFGGDSMDSGRISAKLLLKETGLDADVFIAHIRFKNKDLSVQMNNRADGFLKGLSESKHKGRVHNIDIDPDDHAQGLQGLRQIMSESTSLVGGIVLNSRIYELADLLAKAEEPLRQRVRLVGHDAIERNVKVLKDGTVSFILSQRPKLQGYNAIKALSNYHLFGQIPEKTNFMPIDILIKENVDYYNNYKL